MTDTFFWDEELPIDQLNGFDGPLDEDQVATLWQMFAGISDHWKLDFAVDLLRSRWLDMLQARQNGDLNYTAEYTNASAVFKALNEKLGRDRAIELVYGQTEVTKQEEATTRLRHAKFYVGNDFIRCFVACGGFRALAAGRNYTGFMGGSRFREWAPVRTGSKQ